MKQNLSSKHVFAFHCSKLSFLRNFINSSQSLRYFLDRMNGLMNLLSRIIQNISRRKNEEEDDLDEMEKSTHHTSKSNLHLKNDQIIRFWQRKCFPELSTYYRVPNFRRCQKMLYVLFIKACCKCFFFLKKKTCLSFFICFDEPKFQSL